MALLYSTAQRGEGLKQKTDYLSWPMILDHTGDRPPVDKAMVLNVCDGYVTQVNEVINGGSLRCYALSLKGHSQLESLLENSVYHNVTLNMLADTPLKEVLPLMETKREKLTFRGR